MDETFLYLTTIGHKSGREHRIEIWYVEHESRYYLISEGRHKAHWVQNVTANPNVTFSIGTPSAPESVVALTSAQARTLSEEPAGNDEALASIIRQAMQTKYNWNEGIIVQISP